MLPEEIKDEIFTRIAKLKGMEVPEHQIAAAVGLDEEKLAVILASEKYKAKFSELQLGKYDRHETLNEGWDTVEDDALATVLTYLKTTNDPEYALKAAAMANKAQRRGAHANVPINGGVQAAAVIQLNAVFVKKLQMLRGGQPDGALINGNGKRVDAMDVSRVQKLMHGAQSDIENIFGDVKLENVVQVG